MEQQTSMPATNGYIPDIPMTERINRLRQVLVMAEPEICSERAVIVTGSYRETEGQPAVIRRAKAIKHILEEMTIHIWDDELIVGNHANGRRSAPIFPEWAVYWLEEQLDCIPTRPQDKMVVSDKVNRELRSVFPYWKGRTVHDRVWGTLPDDVKQARTAYIFTVDLYERGSFGHLVYDTPMVLRKGFAGIAEEARRHLASVDESRPDQFQRSLFWKAALIVCEGVIAFAHRYAALAGEKAASETNPARKAELLQIAEICGHVPEKPARNFREALQTAWFLQLLVQIEGNGNSVSLGRLDQHLYPYFAADREKGAITLPAAQELLDCLWIKLNEIIKCWDTEACKVHAGFPMTQNVTVGGQTADGKDATNELTYLFLNTQDHIRLASPQFVCRVHKNTPRELMVRACEIIRNGGGMPALFSDDVVMNSLVNAGVPREKTMDYAIIGCVEPTVIGAFGRNNGGYFNLARVVDCALNDGVDRLTGKQLGVRTGDPAAFTSFEDVKNAVRIQMAHFVKLLATENSIIDVVQAEMAPHVLASTIIPGCMESGKDITAGGARYHWTTPFGAGIATASDSLAAVNRVVYEDKLFSMAELRDALNSNFEGVQGERIRQTLLRMPKYGNDEPEVDTLADFVSTLFFDEAEKYPTGRGGHMVGGLFTLSSTVPHGNRTGATADGRKAREPISDSISPTNGVDGNGPTAVLTSASKLKHGRCSGGNVLNLKFSPGALASADSLEKFASMLRTYLTDLGGMEVQVNVVSGKALREAQADPDRHRDMIIRVAGYSARFVELAADIQEDLITRTEHETV
ncbi:Pyruvate formate-lyase [uncultured delta proteobacterium]|uniref:Pyruvate formate-lyase n=1 Tax=uncultured delta proteobacterium TaxID=34034 RepID=A0A212K820_9DELT|nr:Pyruvate formate-lyase [uncultured delta proteobacterium]